MPKYIIPYEWAVAGEIAVEAASLQEAVKIVDDKPLAELPNEFMGDSFVMRRDQVGERNPHVEQSELRNADPLED